MTNGSQDYIAPGEEIEFDLSFGMKPGWGVMLNCSPTKGAIGTVLVGYGEVQKDYSLKSTVPNVDRKFPTPPTTPVETTTVTAPAETTTVTAPAETVQETVTTTATVTASGGDGSSSGSAIGWIIGLLLAFGLGGAAGFAAQNIPNLPF